MFLGVCIVALFNPIIALVLVVLLLIYEVYLQNAKDEKTSWNRYWKKETKI